MSVSRLVAGVLFTVACTTASKPAGPAVRDPVPMHEASTAPATPVPMHEASTAPATRASATLAAYERVRELLAADEVTGLAEAARAIESAAATAGYHDIATSAAALAAATDLEGARTAFGVVSHDVVTILVADRSLAAGLRIYECPMVNGYRKWVQPSDDMANPYMGKKMLACGGESTWQ